MRCTTIFKGFPLRINIALLTIAIICAAIASHSDEETLRITCLVAGWVLTMVAVVPSLFWYEWERMRKGKGEDVDPDTIVPGWKQFCQSMGIEDDIKVKVFPNLRNAYADRTTNRTLIEIGRPVLKSLDSVSIKAVFAHELAHIKGNHGFKQWCLLVGALLVALFATVLLLGVPYSSDLSGLYLFLSSVSLISIAVAGIAMRFISWPFEYKADLKADQHVQQNGVFSFLNAIAVLRKIDVTRDFYRHPSVNKRIANLDWSQKTRFRKWYFEL
jgi:Zn-dependent protease with chaperone function